MQNTRDARNPFFASSSPAVLATAGAFIGMFALGYAENLKGPTITALMEDLRFSYGQGGSILLGAYLGYLLSTPAAGALIDRFTARWVALFAGVCMFTGSLLYSLTSSFWVLTAAMFIIGLGLGCMNVTSNNLIITYHAARKGRFLNQMGFFHSLASTLAPFIAGMMLGAGLTWRTVYHFSLIPSLVLILYLLAARIPPAPIEQESNENSVSSENPGKSNTFSPTVITYYFLAVVYNITEIGAAAWMVEFLQKVKGQSVELSSASLAAFFACVMVGRLSASFIVERTGYLRAILYAGIGVITCLLIGAYGSPSLAFFLPLSGIFYSLIFPTATAAVSSASGGSNKVLGFWFASAGLGGMLGSWSVGFASDFVGLTTGFGILICSGALVILTVLYLMRKKPALSV